MLKQETIKNAVLSLVLGGGVLAQAACAQPGGGGGQGERRGPPPQAYEACADLSAGDSCEVTGRRGDILQGTCIVPSEEENTVVCAPEGGPHGDAKSDTAAQ